jgi:DNA polymerase I-like protein with 3'-5' exonuclease and polymerase domains
MAMHKREFWEIHDYVAAAIDQAMHENVVIMQDGWRRALPSPFNPAAAANAPVQGTAAAIYRQAVIGMHRAGLPLIATVHDSFVFECRVEDAGDLITTARRIMVAAGAYFLPGVPLKVDVSASVPLPHLPFEVGSLAEPELWEPYLRHLGRAAKARRAA